MRFLGSDLCLDSLLTLHTTALHLPYIGKSLIWDFQYTHRTDRWNSHESIERGCLLDLEPAFLTDQSVSKFRSKS